MNNKVNWHVVASIGLIFLLGLVLPGSIALADSSGPLFPSAGGNDPAVGSVDWLDPANIIANDNLDASVMLTTGQVSHYLAGSNFNFNIPLDATINGIEVTIGHYTSKGGARKVQDHSVKLIKNGAVTGADRAMVGVNWPPTEAPAVYGGTGDLWGTTWTAEEINQPGFGVAVAVTNPNDDSRTAYIDYIHVVVTYSPVLPPELTALTLRQSLDAMTWNPVFGELPAFQMGLNGDDSTNEFLDVQSLSVTKPLKEDLHPFYLNTTILPAEFYSYWDAKGVNSMASGSWQAWMWQIINGTQPMFYLKVTAGPAYKLVDGLMWDYTASEQYLQVSGDYPLGTYTFDGIIEDQVSKTAPVTVNMTFEAMPQLSSLTLRQSLDAVTWTDVFGSLPDYRMDLNGTSAYEYLDVRSLTATKALKVSEHPFYLDTADLPVDFYPYWEAKGVNASANPLSWQGWMWQIINGDQPMFYLKVGAGPTYKLIDGLTWDFFKAEEYLRVSGDYPLGSYRFIGSIEDQIYETSTVAAQITFEALPKLTSLSLRQSLDTTTWMDIYGSLPSFRMALDPLVQFEYIDIDTISINKPLAEQLHPFYLDVTTLPDDIEFYAYWTEKGVTPSSTGWYRWMWDIVTGVQPMFYLKVSPGPTYELIDGLMKDFFGQEVALRVSGDYPLGMYTFHGSITDQIGESSPEAAMITFEPLPWITALTLKGSSDKLAWSDLVGDLVSGYNMALDLTQDFQYIDVTALTPNKDLKVDIHPFNLATSSLPADFFAYWSEKGVNASAADGTWQAWMWQIINGNQPMFYLKVEPGPIYELVDGLSWDFLKQEEYLRVSSDYPLGTYQFHGLIFDQIYESSGVDASITFTRLNHAPIAEAQSLSTSEDTALTLTLVATDTEDDSLTWYIASPAHGVLTGTAPSLIYTPDPDWNGDVSFTFWVNDGTVDSATVTVAIKVDPVNDAPVAVADTYSTLNDHQLVITDPSVLSNDTDIDSIALSVVLVETAVNGTLVLNSDGTFTYTPDYHWSGVDSFTYKAFDGIDYSQEVVVTITVQRATWYINLPIITK